jgi:DNA-directed RNA polymerase specialized sigma24 family protein
MDSDLVVRAQHGDQEAFASLAVSVRNRLHPVAHRILRDIDLAEDATQQALLSIWRDLPQLHDPARFDAWSYRLLVRACYAEARQTRHWAPNLHLLPSDPTVAVDGSSMVVDRDQLERGFRRLSIDHRAVVVLHHYLDSIMRCAGYGRRSMPIRDQLRGRLPNEHRSRGHPHRSVVAGRRRHGAPGPSPGRRARPDSHDPPAPCLVAGAEA